MSRLQVFDIEQVREGLVSQSFGIKDVLNTTFEPKQF